MRRPSEPGANEPAKKVVGFHVEGQPCSPIPASILSDNRLDSGSPTPVIIPPQFQDFTLRAASFSGSGTSTPTIRLANQSSFTGISEAPESSGVAKPERVKQSNDESVVSETTNQAHVVGETSTASSSAAQNPKSESAKAEGKHQPVDEKPKLSRAERRAIQEKQRAAKALAKSSGAEKNHSSPQHVKEEVAKPSKPSTQAFSKPPSRTVSGAKGQAAVVFEHFPSSKVSSRSADGERKSQKTPPLSTTEIFGHLQQFRPISLQNLLHNKEGQHVHPAIIKVGLKYADGRISGGSARCMAMLYALSEVIQDYKTPQGKSLARDLTIHLNSQIAFLVECRPLSVSMGNAIKFLKLMISKIDPSSPEDDTKKHLIETVRTYISEKIVLTDKALISHAVTKVIDGDVVLVYANSHVVLDILLAAHGNGKKFRVIVVDSRPETEGYQLLKRLLQAGIPCVYCLITGLSYIMQEVTKVFLGASAVLSNGTVISRAGAAAVAMMSSSRSIPVLICCGTLKFHERVQLDSITHNELGDPNALAELPGQQKSGALQGWQDQPTLRLLNLKYDAMPAEFVTLIVTEFGMVPPTSVPVLLREYRLDQ